MHQLAPRPAAILVTASERPGSGHGYLPGGFPASAIIAFPLIAVTLNAVLIIIRRL